MVGAEVVVHLLQFEERCSRWITKQMLLLLVGIVFRMSVIKQLVLKQEWNETFISNVGIMRVLLVYFWLFLHLITVKNTLNL